MPKRRWSGALTLKAAIGPESTTIGTGGSTPTRWVRAGIAIATAAQATVAPMRRRFDMTSTRVRRAASLRPYLRSRQDCLGFVVTRAIGAAAALLPYRPPGAEEGRVGASVFRRIARRAFRSSRRQALRRRRS